MWLRASVPCLVGFLSGFYTRICFTQEVRCNDFTVTRFRKPPLYRWWQPTYLDFHCKFTDGFGCQFFPENGQFYRLSASVKVTNLHWKSCKLSSSVTLLGEDLRKRGGGCENLTPENMGYLIRKAVSSPDKKKYKNFQFFSVSNQILFILLQELGTTPQMTQDYWYFLYSICLILLQELGTTPQMTQTTGTSRILSVSFCYRNWWPHPGWPRLLVLPVRGWSRRLQGLPLPCLRLYVHIRRKPLPVAV